MIRAAVKRIKSKPTGKPKTPRSGFPLTLLLSLGRASLDEQLIADGRGAWSQWTALRARIGLRAGAGRHGLQWSAFRVR